MDRFSGIGRDLKEDSSSIFGFQNDSMIKRLDAQATLNLAKKLERFISMSNLNSGEFREASTFAYSFQEFEVFFDRVGL